MSNEIVELPLCPENDPKGEPGVLLSDEILRYVKWFKLIDPFDEKELKPASYKLRVGDEYSVGGVITKISSDIDTIKIPPFEIAIIKTKEKINLPRFLIARWNIRVTQAYRGLLWVGGPQVDPGYFGHLFCPIYNLSNEDVIIKQGEAIATIDFIRTTTFKKKLCKEFERPAPGRQKITDYEPWKLKSAISNLITNNIKKIENDVAKFKETTEKSLEKFHSSIDNFIVITVTAISIIVAAILIIATSIRNAEGVKSFFSWWLLLSNVLSIAAISIAVGYAYQARLYSGESEKIIGKIDQLYKPIIILLIVIVLLQLITLGNFLLG